MSAPSSPPLPPSPEKPPWPGHGLGLPETGARSMGRFGRRILALVIDWGFAVVISTAFFHYDGLATLIIFAVMQIVFTLLFGGSVGHLITRMRVVPDFGGRLQWWRPIVRTVLLCLVIPAVIYDHDQRGLHDRAAGTLLVRI